MSYFNFSLSTAPIFLKKKKSRVPNCALLKSSYLKDNHSVNLYPSGKKFRMWLKESVWIQIFAFCNVPLTFLKSKTVLGNIHTARESFLLTHWMSENITQTLYTGSRIDFMVYLLHREQQIAGN